MQQDSIRLANIITLLQKVHKQNTVGSLTPLDYDELKDVVDYFTVTDPVKVYSEDEEVELEPSLTVTLRLSDGQFLGLVIYLDITAFEALSEEQ